YQGATDGIIAVSRTVADRFSGRLKDASKLHVVLNGTVFPEGMEPLPSGQRADDLVFLGGEKPVKGAFDCLALWSELHRCGFGGKLHWFGEIGPAFLARIEG